MVKPTTKREQTIAIVYPDGTEVRIRRFPALARPGIQDFKELYQHLLIGFCKHNAAMGEILSDPAIVGHLKTVAEMLPVVGKKEPGIDLDKLLEIDDWEQICQVFFSESMTDDGSYVKDADGEDKAYQPSKLSRLNQLDFFGRLSQAIDTLRDQKLQETETRLTSNSSLPAAVLN